MTNRDLFELRDALHSVGHLPGVKFAYAVARNIRLLDARCGPLEDARKPSKEFIEYEKARIELIQKYGERDETNRPRTIDGHAILRDQRAFEIKLAQLKAEYQEHLDAQQKKAEEFETLLDEETDEVPFYRIKIEIIPDGITGTEMSGILPVLDEGETDAE